MRGKLVNGEIVSFGTAYDDQVGADIIDIPADFDFGKYIYYPETEGVYDPNGFYEIPILVDDLNERAVKIQEVSLYMKNVLTENSFANYITNVRLHNVDYRIGGNSLITWYNTINDVWGNFATSGFMTKSYATEERKQYILSILLNN